MAGARRFDNNTTIDVFAAVRVDVERHVRDEAARLLAALVPDSTNVAVCEATRRSEVVDLGRPAEAILEPHRDD